MSRLSALGLIAILGGAQALGACASSPVSSPAPSPSKGAHAKTPTILGLKVEPPPTATTPGEREFQKKPGLISGRDGGLTVYRKLDRGSADPGKPEKVRR